MHRHRITFEGAHSPRRTPPPQVPLGVGMVRLQQARDKKLKTRTTVDGIRFSRHGTRSSREKKKEKEGKTHTRMQTLNSTPP